MIYLEDHFATLNDQMKVGNDPQWLLKSPELMYWVYTAPPMMYSCQKSKP